MPRIIKGAVYSSSEGFLYDEERPQFKYFIPHYTGDFYIVDCTIVDHLGIRLPTCHYAPIHTNHLQIVCQKSETPYNQFDDQ
jgi:hypothetical protein